MDGNVNDTILILFYFLMKFIRPTRWDEWISMSSPRIAPFRSRTEHNPNPRFTSPIPHSPLTAPPVTGVDDINIVIPRVTQYMSQVHQLMQEMSALCELSSQSNDNPVNQQRLTRLSQSLCPIVDRFGRLLTDLSPHFQRLGDGGVSSTTNTIASSIDEAAANYLRR